ncbi:MAG: hypothetical protein U5L08_11470 [Xanthomonadales bacterium]|nr:hypothetical protein [Xanthomonadales bacterium]
MAASRRAAWANLAGALFSQPFVSILLAVSCLGAIALFVTLVSAALDQYASILFVWLTQRAPLLWSAVFLTCLASQVPAVRREIEAARSGWLSALPQMPEAMRAWSRWRRWGLAMLQSLGLVAVVAAVYREAATAVTPAPAAWIAPVLVPAMAALLAPVLAGPSRRDDHPRPPPARTAAATRSGARILHHWQWLHYRSRCWRAGIRWSFGLLIVLMPAGASAVQVGIGLAVGLVFLQFVQLWSSALQVIFRASALLGALPLQPWRILLQVSVLPLLIASAIALVVGLVLAALGLSFPGAVVAGLALFGALTLNLAVVLAWRHDRRFAGFRSAFILLAWLALAQAVPFAAPLSWLGLIGWLLRRAGRLAP